MENTILIISLLLSAFFIFASSIKLFAWQKKIFQIQLSFFHKYGLNRTIMALVGLVELLAAIALWLPGYGLMLGAAGIAMTSLGAIYCHVRFDSWKDAIPAMVTLSLSLVLLLPLSSTV